MFNSGNDALPKAQLGKGGDAHGSSLLQGSAHPKLHLKNQIKLLESRENLQGFELRSPARVGNSAFK